MQQKGLIALDIDGTLTDKMQPIPGEIIRYLHDLVRKGWLMIFITGRTFHMAHQVLNVFSFPYFLAVQNGAIILEMPSKKIIAKKYLQRAILPLVETLCDGEPTDFVIYAGFEYDDLCYFRASRFSLDLLEYLKARRQAYQEEWRSLPSLQDIDIDEFSSIKCFGAYPSMQRIVERVEKQLNLHIPIIRDPFQKGYYVAQATHPSVNKGQAIADLVQLLGNEQLVIAAGDDLNDLSMFDRAHIRIAMQEAPKELLQKADIVAPPASQMGLIKGLNEAISLKK